MRLLPKPFRSLDEGCGHGLLVRLLRDDGEDAWGHDPYAQPIFAEDRIKGVCPDGSYSLICAAEVIEHTTNPVGFLKNLASKLDAYGIIIVSTDLFDPTRVSDPAHWHYLAADYGQHITFLSPVGFEIAATQAGLVWWGSLNFAGTNGIHLLSRYRPSRWTFPRLNLLHRLGELRHRVDCLV